MKNEYSIFGGIVIAKFSDVVTYDKENKTIFCDSSCKNKQQMRELILNSDRLEIIYKVRYKNKFYSIADIYKI